MRWILLVFIFCHSLFWPICYSLKKNRFAADACVPIINTAVGCEEFSQVQQDGCQSGLAFLACWHLIVTLSWAHLLHRYFYKWLSTRRLYQGLQQQGESGFFSLLPFFEEWLTISPVQYQIDGCSATISCHFWTDVPPWWLEAWVGAVVDSSNSLVGFVYVLQISCLLTGFRSNFMSHVWIAQLLFARGFFSVVNYRIIIAN